MITYKTCTDVSLKQIFEAFRLGFSDYIIPVTINEIDFNTHFWGPEGNQLDYSYIAFDDIHPVGLILSGIRIFDGIKTMRCGTLCLSPEYRGKGISQVLFEMHKKAAINAGCKQLFLEVLRENHRAIKFYKKQGYLEATILKYYSATVTSIPSLMEAPPYKLTTLTYDNIKGFRDKLRACHINWQSDTPYYEHTTNDVFLGMYDEDQLLAMIAVNSKGKINFLWVDPAYRSKGLAHYLVLAALQQLKVEKMTVCIPSNALLEGFFRKLQFQKDKIEQYEMYLPL
ncbi:MAG: family acetyltransferase [Herbinix sp.]|jgi:ribosomal protein S18 acetylase RimI-like enzyme|nr:family acetyltransferase [Herbinix sp.]